jgi:imidazolonepropionase-like amidohydrolase
MSRRSVCLVALFLLAAPLCAEAPGVFAITGGTVHPVSGAAIPNGVVIIRGGLIEAVGANLAIPADATVIDAKGGHVYPGLIDAGTSFGFASAAPRRRGFGGGGGAPAQPATPPPAEPTAASVAVRDVKLSDDDLEAKRATGVTTVLTVPSSGIFNGQSAILNLGEGPIESRVIRAAATQQVSFNPRAAWTYPDSLMGVISYIKQAFLDAQQNAAALAIYNQNPAGNKRPDQSASADALAAVVRRDLPVVFVADSELMMRRAMAIGNEFKLRYVLSGARQAYRMADELKTSGIPVLVSVKWPTAPASKEDREEQPLRVIRDRQLAPTSPAALVKSGATFALVSGSGKTGDFLPGIRKAIENGLSADDALRATTLSPARIFGIDRQLGSLEKGKIADIVISDKPIFEEKAKVTHVLIDGRETKLGTPPSGGGGASPLDGTWRMTVKSSTGDVSITATLHVEDSRVTGTYSGDRGSGDIRNGSFDGTTVEFTIAAKSETESNDWVFHGTVSGTSMTGTVSTTLGTFQFSGSKGQ